MWLFQVEKLRIVVVGKESNAKLSSFMELVKRVAKLHNKELEQGDQGAKEKFTEDKKDLTKNKWVG